MTKSAIKKANRLARLERKQRQKLKQGGEQEQPPITPISPQPATVILGERPPTPILVVSSESLPLEPQSLEQASKPPEAPEASLVNIPTENPPTATSTNAPVPEFEENCLEKDSPRNGSVATISVASSNQVSRSDPETAKKRQNALTRILWTFIMIGGFIGIYSRTIFS